MWPADPKDQDESPTTKTSAYAVLQETGSSQSTTESNRVPVAFHEIKPAAATELEALSPCAERGDEIEDCVLSPSQLPEGNCSLTVAGWQL
jgi:hypothetical protein